MLFGPMRANLFFCQCTEIKISSGQSRHHMRFHAVGLEEYHTVIGIIGPLILNNVSLKLTVKG